MYNNTQEIEQDVNLSKVSEAQIKGHSDQIGILYLFPHYDTSVNKII